MKNLSFRENVIFCRKCDFGSEIRFVIKKWFSVKKKLIIGRNLKKRFKNLETSWKISKKSKIFKNSWKISKKLKNLQKA